MASDVFRPLLEASIEHLEQLRQQGVRHVAVRPETLTSLQEPPRRPANPPRSPELSNPSLNRPPPPSTPPSLPALSSTPGLDPAARTAAFEDLRQRALSCQRCPNLATSRKSVVFGVGNIHADILFIGEAPGADEDSMGEPFVGKAGELLTRIITAMGLTRDQVYIANVLKCRPDTPGQFSGNRKPNPEEMATCLPFLQEQIELIRPKVLIALGATAIEGILGTSPIQVTKVRGQWMRFRDIPLMPTFHPAYLLRNESVTEKRKVWEDMMAVMEQIGMPISEKQRRFFTKAA
jgi:uracil-DNA glycosylase family 4